MQCPFCHAALAQNAKFCRACGKSLTKTCPHCDKPNDLAARFCAGCGYAFSNNAAKESGTEDAGTGSVSSQQPPIDIPRPVPTAPQEPPSPQLVEPENASHSHTSLPTNALDPSANQSVSTQDFSPEPVGLKTDQSVSTSETRLMQPISGGNESSRMVEPPSRTWKSIWIALFVTIIVTGAAGGYYFYSQSSASPKTDVIQAAQSAESPALDGASAPKSGTSAVQEETAIDGVPPGNNIEDPAAVKAKQIMARGESVYLSNCSACHQVNGRGLPGAFPAIDGSKSATGDVDKHILVVMSGRPGTAMPGFGDHLTDAEIAAVVTYQRNAWSNRDSGAILDADDIKQFRHSINKPQVSLMPPATATRAPEQPKGARELLIGHWRTTGGIIEYLPDGSTQGYRGDGSRLDSGWWRLEGDRLTIGWVRNGRRQEAGCTVLSVNEMELRCQNERGVQLATRLAREDLPQRQVEPQTQPVQQDKTRQGSNVIQQFFIRELEKLKQCEGKWGTTPECPASSWGEE